MTNDVTGIGKPRKRKYVDLLTKIDLWMTWVTVKEVKIKDHPFSWIKGISRVLFIG